ncbi:MAG: hypothetical protein HQM08_03765 [Candidatus Riflebacteria bacterium]|nr:hypothetical protein [Candidatus Riflebacteria bacterium]
MKEIFAAIQKLRKNIVFSARDLSGILNILIWKFFTIDAVTDLLIAGCTKIKQHGKKLAALWIFFFTFPLYSCNDLQHYWRGEHFSPDNSFSKSTFETILKLLGERSENLKRGHWIISNPNNEISSSSVQSLKDSVSMFVSETSVASQAFLASPPPIASPESVVTPLSTASQASLASPSSSPLSISLPSVSSLGSPTSIATITFAGFELFPREIPMEKEKIYSDPGIKNASGVIWFSFLNSISGNYDNFDPNLSVLRTGRRESVTLRILALGINGDIVFIDEINFKNEFYFEQVVDFDFLYGGSRCLKYSFLRTPMEDFGEVQIAEVLARKK